MNRNYSIKCNVNRCVHNANGCNCSLDCVHITCGEGACTRCGNYCEK